jgi:hypothetical protein
MAIATMMVRKKAKSTPTISIGTATTHPTTGKPGNAVPAKTVSSMKGE